jgi:hypothetical protein
MGRKDSSKADTGGVRSAGAVVSAARGRLRDAAALPAVSKDEGRPPYSGPRRGGIPKGIHPLKGLIAPNYVRTGVFLREDLLDLLNSASWRHPLTRNCQDLRGASLCAMIACCGATMCELTRIECSNWLPGKRNEVELGGAKHRQPRTMPMLAFAKLVIDAYHRQVKRAPGVTHLFVDDDGLPASAFSLLGQFQWMTSKNGIPVDSLAMVLHNAFEAWARTDEGPMMRALTGRVKRKWLAPDPKFSIEEKREALEIVHPLAPVDREMLQWKGPYARRYPNPHFPALSRQARTEYEFALKTGGGTTYGAELRDAVRTALDSGKLVAEVAAHYGMNVSYVQDVRDGKVGERDVTLRIRPLQLSLLQFLRGNPPPHVEQVRAWAMAQHGVDLPLQRIYKFARKHGVKLARSPRFRLHGHGDTLLLCMRQEPTPSAPEVREWALSERRIDLTLKQIRGFAAKHGMTLAPMERSSLDGHEAALLAHAATMPDKNAAQLASWLMVEKGVETAEKELEEFLLARGWTKPAKSVLNGYVQAVRDLVAADPHITYREIQGGLAERGVLASTVGIRYAMEKAGIKKLSQTQSAKKARAAARR